MTTLNIRIQQRREALGLDRPTLAELCGVSPETIRLWETSSTSPYKQRLKLVAEQLKTTVEWLTVGISANLEHSGTYAFIPRFQERDWKDGTVHYHHQIGDLTDANDTFAYRKDFLASIGVQPHACRVALLPDDSMALGSQLLVDTDSRELVNGKVYAFASRHGVLVRRVYLLTSGQVELRADNPAMRVETHVREQLPAVLGRVVAFQGTL
jgi:transcriptional regulator with XRE-family HTH domain